MESTMHSSLAQCLRNVCTCIVLCLSPNVLADTFHVTNIQEFAVALDVVETNEMEDTILLEAGTYNVADLAGAHLSYTAGTLPRENYPITIRGTNGTPIIEASADQGLKIDTRVTGGSQRDAHVTVNGIKIQHGRTSNTLSPGGALHIRTQNGDITVLNCTFVSNFAKHIYFEPSGGGVYVKTESGGNILVSNNVFLANEAHGDGGGLMLIGGVTAVLEDNVFTGNTSWGNGDFYGGGGGAAYISGPNSLVVQNNTFVGNTNSGAHALCSGGALYIRTYLDSYSAALHRNVFWDNGVCLGAGGDVFVENDGNNNATGATVTVANNNIADLAFEITSNMTTQQNTNVDPILLDYGDSPAPDTDSDGLPDAWEWAGGLDPNNASGDSGDDGNPDGDKYSNMQEYIAGTDPNDPSSLFQVASISNAAESLTFDFTSVTGRYYQVQGLLDLANDTWSIVVTNLTGTGGQVSVANTNGDSNAFYRVRVSLTPWN